MKVGTKELSPIGIDEGIGTKKLFPIRIDAGRNHGTLNRDRYR